MPRGGRREGSGNPGWKHNFEAAVMLGQSAGILLDAQNRAENYKTEEGKIKIDVAKTVFNKLAPSKVEIDSKLVAQITH